MKAKIQPFNQDPITLRKCVNTLTSLGWCCLSAWLSLPGHVQKQQLNLAVVAHPKARIILAVKVLLSQLRQLISNKRHVVGAGLWVVGIGSLFAHLFFDPYSFEHQVCSVLGFDPAHCWNGKGGAASAGWCYTSWFDYFVQTRFFIALLFWSVSIPLLLPSKFSVALSSVVHGIGWCWLIHYSFFSTSYETINAFPEWGIVMAGLVLGFSIVMSADYLIHAYNHRFMAFEKRLLTLYNGADLVDDHTFKGLFKKFVEEKQAFQKTI